MYTVALFIGVLSVLFLAPLVVLTYLYEGITKQTLSANSQAQKLFKKPFILLHAHPDDEVMFFLPTLLTVRDNMDPELFRESHLVCMTSSSVIRANEYIKSAQEVLQKDSATTHVVHNSRYDDFCPNRQEIVSLHLDTVFDGFNYTWDEKEVTNVLLNLIGSSKVEDLSRYNIITFDNYGVSGHPNHISCYSTAKSLHKQCSSINVFTLQSVSLIEKYVPAIFVNKLIFTSSSFNGIVITRPCSSTLQHAFKNIYLSQKTWYRSIFALISSYVRINKLVLLD